METISISTPYLGHTHRETISTRNSTAIIKHMLGLGSIVSLKPLRPTFVLWSDLESSRMNHWNKKHILPFGASSTLYHPWNGCSKQSFFNTDSRLIQVKSIAEYSKGSILQYFRSSLGYRLSFRCLFCLFLSGRFTQVLLYLLSFCKNIVKPCPCDVVVEP